MAETPDISETQRTLVLVIGVEIAPGRSVNMTTEALATAVRDALFKKTPQFVVMAELTEEGISAVLQRLNPPGRKITNIGDLSDPNAHDGDSV